jgi:type II secretory pathway pseudopilin PulG
MVVAIVLIIAAIAVPNLLRSRMAANEASAVDSIRAINTAEVTYAATYPHLGFALLPALGGAGGSSTGAGLIDAALASGVKSGYQFSVTTGGATGSGPATTYMVNADPRDAQTGQRHFFSDQSGVLRYHVSQPASASDSPLQ